MSIHKTITKEDLAHHLEVGTTPPSWVNLVEGECKLCDDPNYPVSHVGSSMCKSHGLGARNGTGTRAHCSCDACF